MSTSQLAPSSNTPTLTNGSGEAAILSAGVGSFALAVLAMAADKSPRVASSLIFYKPTVSGVTTAAILIWLFTCGILEWRWRNKTVPARRINAAALILLGLRFLLTFPPIADLLWGESARAGSEDIPPIRHIKTGTAATSRQVSAERRDSALKAGSRPEK
jgi:hypothetical protein